jgi:pyridoxine 4-dehydrogenase
MSTHSEPMTVPKVRGRLRIKPASVITIGKYHVPAIGMGTLPLGTTYAPGGRPDRQSAIELVHRALLLGVRFFDTADTYGSGPKDNHYVETLLTEAIDTYKGGCLIDEVVIATKAGMTRVNDRKDGWRPRNFKDGAALQTAILDSYRALGSRPIKLWWFHHTDGYDTNDPSKFQEACRAVKELVDQGIVENVGLCNCSTSHIDIAMAILPIVAVQNAFSLYERAASQKRFRKGPAAKSNKNEILEYCAKNGIIFCPHGALGGLQTRDGRRNLETDFPMLSEMSVKKNVSPQVLVLAWMLQKYANVLHIFGTRTCDHLHDVLIHVPKVVFTQKELDDITQLSPR